MTELFNQYTSKYERFRILMQDEISRSLRLFNIRFRLSLDIQIDFKGEISLTKSQPVRDTYALIIRLMETWNAYEALFHYIKELGKYANPKVIKSKIYSKKFLETVGSLKTLKVTVDKLKIEYNRNVKFKSDINQYISRIENDNRIKSTLTEDSKNVLAYFKEEKSISGIEILSLIYAERNMYYHNGETAKMGMTYTNRKKLINQYLECLSIHTLKLINYILDEEIKENQ